MSTGITAVAFDFGGPVLLTPFERVRWLERHLHLPERSLDWRGPFDPHGDALWRQMQDGRITDAKTLTGLLWLQNHLNGDWSLQWQAAG